MYKPYKNKFMNNGGQYSLGRLGQPNYEVFQSPPEEYRTFSETNEPGFEQPAFQQPVPTPYGYDNPQDRSFQRYMGMEQNPKEARRRRFLQKRRNKMRGGLQQLYRGKNLWK